MSRKMLEKTVKELSEEKVRELIAQLPHSKHLHKQAEVVCYDRLLCESLGIDYNSVNNIDFARAYIYCYWRETDG